MEMFFFFKVETVPYCLNKNLPKDLLLFVYSFMTLFSLGKRSPLNLEKCVLWSRIKELFFHIFIESFSNIYSNFGYISIFFIFLTAISTLKLMNILVHFRFRKY